MLRTGRSENQVKLVEEYLRNNKLFRNYKTSNDDGV